MNRQHERAKATAKGQKRNRSKKNANQNKRKSQPKRAFLAQAQDHQKLIDDKVHVFVDDQNLFYGIINTEKDQSYRIDFGSLLRVSCQSSETGFAREVGSAYIAGVVPDDDSFWEAAKSKGFTVNRGFLSAGGRSKQDDAYLITQIMETLYEQGGPSTMVLVAGDADYAPPLEKCLKKGWRVELAFTESTNNISDRLSYLVHEFREFTSQDIAKKNDC